MGIRRYSCSCFSQLANSTSLEGTVNSTERRRLFDAIFRKAVNHHLPFAESLSFTNDCSVFETVLDLHAVEEIINFSFNTSLFSKHDCFQCGIKPAVQVDGWGLQVSPVRGVPERFEQCHLYPELLSKESHRLVFHTMTSRVRRRLCLRLSKMSFVPLGG